MASVLDPIALPQVFSVLSFPSSDPTEWPPSLPLLITDEPITASSSSLSSFPSLSSMSLALSLTELRSRRPDTSPSLCSANVTLRFRDRAFGDLDVARRAEVRVWFW